jgi:hypothetical protein
MRGLQACLLTPNKGWFGGYRSVPIDVAGYVQSTCRQQVAEHQYVDITVSRRKKMRHTSLEHSPSVLGAVQRRAAQYTTVQCNAQQQAHSSCGLGGSLHPVPPCYSQLGLNTKKWKMSKCGVLLSSLYHIEKWSLVGNGWWLHDRTQETQRRGQWLTCIRPVNKNRLQGLNTPVITVS